MAEALPDSRPSSRKTPSVLPSASTAGFGGDARRGLALDPARERETACEAVFATEARDLSLVDLKVVDNQTRTAAIELRNCVDGQIRDCLVQNYQRVDIDDRTGTPDQGFAFRCIIGTGILIRQCQGTLIRGNRVREDRLVATPEVKRRYGLGQNTRKTRPGGESPAGGTGTGERPTTGCRGRRSSRLAGDDGLCTQVIGNLVEQAGKASTSTPTTSSSSQNIVNDALIGMKAMHGSKRVIVTRESVPQEHALEHRHDARPASLPARPPGVTGRHAPANVDGGSIIAGNVISDFGLGQTQWIWPRTRLPDPVRPRASARESSADGRDRPGQHGVRHRPRHA